MIWITLTAAKLVMPARVFLAVGDTVEVPAFLVQKGEKKRVKPKCSVIKGKSIKAASNRLIGVEVGRSLVGCRYRDNKRVIVAVVSDRKRGEMRPPKRLMVLRVGEKIALPKVDVPKGHEVKWFVKPRWIAKIVGDSVEGLSEGRGIIQVHIVRGNVVVREFPIRLIVVDEDTSITITPRFTRLRVGDAVQFNLSGEYSGKVEWYVVNQRVGRITDEGLFVALRPGRTVVVARVRGKDGKVISAKAMVVVKGKPKKSRRKRKK